jgi:hypothetical protein
MHLALVIAVEKDTAFNFFASIPEEFKTKVID